MGFSGIAVAFLGGLNPVGVLFAGYFIQHITVGGSLIDMRYYNPQIADLISSIIIYTCGFSLFFKEMITRIFSRKQGNEISENLKNEDSENCESGSSSKNESETGKDIKNEKGEQAR